jgi:tRNA U34 2-thiouridine synthase MnmA/TrmU
MKKKYRCFALFSGGLDSMLSVLHMSKLGYEVIPIFFKSLFFGPKNARKAAEQIGFELIVHDISEKHLQMLKNPHYGFGKNMNPCIDCHGLMFREAAQLMEQYKIDFIISGEVLGQRPMSQRHDALNAVGKLSKVKDLLIRPLSQKLLTDTLPIHEGWVKKEEMLDIQGRGRYYQIEMAKKYGITFYQNPGGGCLLTDAGYSRRLRDLMDHDMMEIKFIEFLKFGRHFRINDNWKIIVGRNEKDNDALTDLAVDDIVLQAKDFPGPLGILNSMIQPIEEEIKIAATLLLRYCNKSPKTSIVVYGKKNQLQQVVEVKKMPAAKVEEYLI